MPFTEEALRGAIAKFFHRCVAIGGFAVDPGDEDEAAEVMARHVFADLKKREAQ